jgi:hypothetical protein
MIFLRSSTIIKRTFLILFGTFSMTELHANEEERAPAPIIPIEDLINSRRLLFIYFSPDTKLFH